MLEHGSTRGDVMSEHRATLSWNRGSTAFRYETCSCGPVGPFTGGVEVAVVQPRDALR
jgi:hypothetical protein